MNSGEAFSSVHVGASSVMRAASTGALIDPHGTGAETLSNTLKRHNIQFHKGLIGITTLTDRSALMGKVNL
jgi:tRNA G26 N,N-dimethylase Trm1